MIRTIEKYKRQLLAVFAVFLMIVFIGPQQCGQGQHGDPSYEIGKLDGRKVLAGDLNVAQNKVQFLRYGILVPMSDGRGASLLDAVLPPATADLLADRPELFHVLREEARQMGVSASNEKVESYLQQCRFRLDNSESLVPWESIKDTARGEAARRATADLIAILDAQRRGADVVKLSQPILQHELATSSQLLTLQIKPFDAGNLVSQVPAPTDAQLQEMFDAFGEDSPGAVVPEKNPFGFGYRFPNRMKLQYIALTRKAARETVRASKSDYDWDVAAREYYLKNQSRFTTTTQPTPTTSPTTTAAAAVSTQPITIVKPFEQVRDQIMSAVTEPEVDRLMRFAQDRIVCALNLDWQAYRGATAGATTMSATTAPAPMSSLGVPFDSYDYLLKLRDEVGKQFKLFPDTGNESNGWKSAADIAQLPVIGGARYNNTAVGDYAAEWGEAFLPADRREDARAMSQFEPSQVFASPSPLGDQDRPEALVFFRLTEMDPSRKPGSLEEVRADVERDFRARESYDLALSSARALLELAKAGGLAAVAPDSRSVSAEAMREQIVFPLPDLASNDLQTFKRKAYEMLQQLATENGDGKTNILNLIELPDAGRVYVAQITGVRPARQDPREQFAFAQLQSNQLQGLFGALLAREWFDEDSIIQRNNFVDLTGRTRKRKEAIGG